MRSKKAWLLAGLWMAASSAGNTPQSDAAEPSAEPGAMIAFAYTADALYNTQGGLQRGGAYLDLLDLAADFPGGKLFGLDGLSARARVQYANGRAFSESFVGDAQTVSNIEAAEGLRVYELWLQWSFGARTGQSLLLGLYDLNSEFDTLDSSGLFTHSPHGIGVDIAQTGRNGPSIYPMTSLGLRWRADLVQDWVVKLVALDGVPGDPDRPDRQHISLSAADGAMLVGEVIRQFGESGRFGIGAWNYTAPQDRLISRLGAPLPDTAHGDHGAYLFAERALGGDAARRVSLFGRFGWADPRFNPFEYFVGSGLTVDAPFAARADDRFGIAIAMARTGSDYRRQQQALGARATAGETNLEITYQAALGERLVLQPTVQYVLDPGADAALADALVVGVRFQLELTRALRR